MHEQENIIIMHEQANKFTHNYCWVAMTSYNFETNGKVIFLEEEEKANVTRARKLGFNTRCPFFFSSKIPQETREQMKAQIARDFEGEVVDFMDILKEDFKDERLAETAKKLSDVIKIVDEIGSKAINEIENPKEKSFSQAATKLSNAVHMFDERNQIRSAYVAGQICIILDLIKLYMATKENNVALDFNIEIEDPDTYLERLNKCGKDKIPYFAEGDNFVGSIENKLNYCVSIELFNNILQNVSKKLIIDDNTLNMKELDTDCVYSCLLAEFFDDKDSKITKLREVVRSEREIDFPYRNESYFLHEPYDNKNATETLLR